jgi:D-alanyl-D-alanine carboxypeptidase/D-alanyl-D-alanine-endopeptidase (penicillin-binding protein 4)
MGFPSVGVVGVLSLLLGTQVARPLQPLISLNAVPANPWQVPWLAQRNAPDPTVAAILDQYINTLAARGYAPEQQGVWVQTGTTAIAAHQGTTPLPVASLTKLATTLAALATWPVDHQFETRIGRRGSVENGVLVGDLIILGGGDPYFVWEEAIVLANALQAQGIQQVSGNLVILGDFTMNFEADPYRSGELLRTAFDAGLWPPEAQQQYGTLPPATPQPRLKIGGTVVVENVAAADQVSAWVMGHQSLPLVALLKAMNIYSNNAMADNFARTVGGVNTIKAQVVEQAQLPLDEIYLANGSGLGEENQISPRGVVAILSTIQRQLSPHGLSIADVMPVFGQDVGTLVDRRLPDQAALKTGSLAAVSSLAGVFPTRDRGLVWFAIVNRGYDLEGFRDRQDALLAALQSHWGTTVSPQVQPKVQLGQPPYHLGDPQRNLPEGE